jgi:transmembrane 9 superfamily member 3
LPRSTICSSILSDDDAAEFAEAVIRHYWYELFMDDLPIWGFVGPPPEQTSAGDTTIYIYTHKTFDIAYNGNRIIHVNLTSENPVAIANGAKLEFTYAVNWHPSDVPFERRFERYLDYSFFEHQIHWFSVFNSFMMVIFLVGLVSMILLRTLRKDYARYSRREDDDLESLERDMAEESGWKLVHGDVFRPPAALDLLAALVGTGVQLALLVLVVILVTIAGALFAERGTIVTAFIVLYALTSFFGGYISGGFYARNEGRSWIRAMLLTANLFPLTVAAIAFVLNTIAIFYQSLAAVPFGSIVVLLLIWIFVSFPLCLLGTVVGRNWAGAPDNPCRVKRIPSPIPERPWYLRPAAVALAGGLLPFGSIFIEMYFVFTSFWNYKVYYVYGFFLLVFLILLIVTVCVTIVATYFLLNAENYRWHWTAFGAGGSTSLYVFMYAVHYFMAKTKMTGFFQTSFYFGYTAMFCIGVGVMCGAVGYLGAAAFVRRIYRNIKCD